MNKRIGRSDIIGEQGIEYIRRIVLDMGHVFYETGGVEERPHSAIGNKARSRSSTGQGQMARPDRTVWKRPAAWSKDGARHITTITGMPRCAMCHFAGTILRKSAQTGTDARLVSNRHRCTHNLQEVIPTTSLRSAVGWESSYLDNVLDYDIQPDEIPNISNIPNDEVPDIGPSFVAGTNHPLSLGPVACGCGKSEKRP